MKNESQQYFPYASRIFLGFASKVDVQILLPKNSKGLYSAYRNFFLSLVVVGLLAVES